MGPRIRIDTQAKREEDALDEKLFQFTGHEQLPGHPVNIPRSARVPFRISHS